MEHELNAVASTMIQHPQNEANKENISLYNHLLLQADYLQLSGLRGSRSGKLQNGLAA